MPVLNRTSILLFCNDFRRQCTRMKYRSLYYGELVGYEPYFWNYYWHHNSFMTKFRIKAAGLQLCTYHRRPLQRVLYPFSHNPNNWELLQPLDELFQVAVTLLTKAFASWCRCAQRFVPLKLQNRDVTCLVRMTQWKVSQCRVSSSWNVVAR